MSRKWQTKKEMLQFSSKSFQSQAFHHFTRQGVPQPRVDRTEWPVADRHEMRPWNDQLVRWRWSQTSPAGHVGDASQVIREDGSVPSGVGYWERCPLFSRLYRESGERRELPQRRPAGRKRILAYFKGHWTLLLYLYDKKIWGGGNLH